MTLRLTCKRSAAKRMRGIHQCFARRWVYQANTQGEQLHPERPGCILLGILSKKISTGSGQKQLDIFLFIERWREITPEPPKSRILKVFCSVQKVMFSGHSPGARILSADIDIFIQLK